MITCSYYYLMKIQTNISEVFWCNYNPKEKEECTKRRTHGCTNAQCNGEPVLNKIEKAEIRKKNISWFDELFNGGIEVNKNDGPINMLIAGPPGSGKSTLALELCYQLALQKEPLLPLYISFESNTRSLIKKAERFGWDIANRIVPYDGDNEKFIEKIKERGDRFLGTIAFWDKETIRKKITNLENWSLSFNMISQIIQVVSHNLLNIKESFPNLSKSKTESEQKKIDEVRPNILIIDSLNIAADEFEKRMIFDDISEKLTNTDLVITILDSDSFNHKDWEYRADIILRLDYNSNDDYFLRTIEIIKARDQEHTLGKHQLKIHSRSEEGPEEQELSYCDRNIIRHRSHPNKETGGITIYPSIHYYLSRYRKRTSPTAAETTTESPFQIGDILRIPVGRCTAFTGSRGTHKSHAAYLHLLYNIIYHGYKGVIITLREDEKKTLETLQIILNQIIEQNAKTEGMPKFRNIYDYIHNNRLEILYYLPGYITPNEFFHRIFVSTHRMKKNNSEKVIAVFNSLDQVEPRFPLCAKEEIFIPAIIEFFLGEHVTTIFIAVDDNNKPLEKYGLLPMADYILLFKKVEIPYEDFKSEFVANDKLENYFDGQDHTQERIHTVNVSIDRHAGGRPNIISGYLELASSKNSYFKQEGIYFSKPKLS